MALFRYHPETGWPSCPECLENELYSPYHAAFGVMGDSPAPTLKEYLGGVLWCAEPGCGWAGYAPMPRVLPGGSFEREKVV